MNNKKQSSVEWLEECLSIHFTHEQKMQFNGLFEQAKAMHKEEIEDSYCQGCFDITKDDAIFPRETSEQYYKETFEK